MASLKSREIDPFLNKPDFSKPVFLIYGPDAGLVSERADTLAEKCGVDLSDPFCLIRMNADDAAADPARIASEAHTIGMFGGKRLIRISGTTRRDLAKAVQPVLDTPPEDTIIIIEAGDLKKSAGLRKKLETSKEALCIPCYEDNDQAIERLIEQEIRNKGFSIDRETTQTLKSMLGSDRLVSRGELIKLALYCEGEKTITLEHVQEIVGDSSKLVLDELVDSVATGQIPKLQILLPKAVEAGNSPDMIIWAVLRHFQMLQLARTKTEAKRQSVENALGGIRPPIHFSRKNLVSQAIRLWPLARIERALQRLDKSMFECRKNADMGQSLAGTSLLALALEANALNKR